MSSSLNSWQIRIEAAQESIRRSRYSFLVATIVAIALLIVAYNESISWDRIMLSSPSLKEIGNSVDCKSNNIILKSDQKCLTLGEKLRFEEIYKRWQNDLTITNSLLGAKINADDAIFVGPPIIVVLLMWSVYSARRENHSIHALLTDAINSFDKSIIDPVFYAISGQTVFITVSDDNDARSTIGWNCLTCENRLSFTSAMLRLILNAMYWLPFLSLFVAFLLELSTVIRQPINRPNCNHPMLWRCFQGSEQIWTICGLVISTTIMIFVFILSLHLVNFQQATRDVLRQFANERDRQPWMRQRG